MRSFEAKQDNSQNFNQLEPSDHQRLHPTKSAPFLIEEFYEYGGRAVCSNHVFNFKIGKRLNFNVLVDEESDLVTDRTPFFNPMYTH